VAGVQDTIWQVPGMVSKSLMADPVFLLSGALATDNRLSETGNFSTAVKTPHRFCVSI
jgi:hypothetical protein